MIPWIMDLVEMHPKENADFIYEALKDRELLDLARGRWSYGALVPAYPPHRLIELEIETSPGAWYMISVNNPIGWTRLTPVDRWEASLGIVIADSAYRNKGVGYEVCKAMLNNAFPVFRKVTWYTWDYNDASILLAKKLGFKLVQTIPYCHFKAGQTVQDYNGLKFSKGRLDDYEDYEESKKNKES